MTVYADGRFRWEGSGNVRVRGKKSGRMSPKDFSSALLALDRAGYLDLKNRYSGGDDCEIWATDNSSMLIEVIRPNGNKTIDHYLGCRVFPDEQRLKELEANLEKIFQLGKFVGN
jgi:hypothetical protein